MCGRFELSEPSRLLSRYPHLRFDDDFAPRYNVAPTQLVAGTCNDDAGRVLSLYWGFIPPWDSSGSRYSTINAKAETLESKPLYRAAFHADRAVIYADGFFEWQRVPGSARKQPRLIRMRNHEPFAMAALWQPCRSPEGNELRTTTIVTTEANTLLKPIHDRMPAILSDDTLRVWLSMGNVSPLVLKALLKPYPADEMEAVPVSMLVNDVCNDSPAVIEPLRGVREPLSLF